MRQTYAGAAFFVPGLPVRPLRQKGLARKSLSKKRMRRMERTKERKQYFFVVQELVSRELKRRYSRSRLGILWSVLNPLLSMAVLSMLFSTMFRRSIENYPVYYLTGSLLWTLFSTGTNGAMTALTDNKALLLQVRLPKTIFPLARVWGAFVNLLYSLAAYAVILLIFGIRPSLSMLAFPAVTALAFLFTLGVGNVLAILYSFFGDIRHLYSVVLTLWMYLSALFYPVSALPEAVRRLLLLNPMYSYITAARECVMYGRFPSGFLWLSMGIWAVLSWAGGSLVFRKWQNRIIERL